MIKQTFRKAAAPIALAAALLFSSGCVATTMQRGFSTGAGAALGGAAGHVLSDGDGAATIGGAVIGGIVGRQFEPACVNETNTRLSRSINGNSESAWTGSQTYTENCIGKGGQDIPRANLPRSTQTKGFSFTR